MGPPRGFNGHYRGPHDGREGPAARWRRGTTNIWGSNLFGAQAHVLEWDDDKSRIERAVGAFPCVGLDMVNFVHEQWGEPLGVHLFNHTIEAQPVMGSWFAQALGLQRKDWNNVPYVKTMAWLLDHGCPWDVTVCASAVARSEFGVLLWLRSQDPPCPWRLHTLWVSRLKVITQREGYPAGFYPDHITHAMYTYIHEQHFPAHK